MSGELAGLRVFERGWLSANNVLIGGERPGDPATLVDSSHCLHAGQTLALLHAALDGAPLGQVLNTHLHSDHCGGNAALQRAFGAKVRVPQAGLAAVNDWDEGALSFRATGQRAERFRADGGLTAGETLVLGGRNWQLVAAPGHEPDALMLFEAASGLLISGDALWENGFGVVFPELDGIEAFDQVEATLDTIERLPVRRVIPGHGAVFDDVAAALVRARSRLRGFRADPARHARHGAKVLVKYHLMEEQRQAMPDLLDWAANVPLLQSIRQRTGTGVGSEAHRAWCEALVAELVQSGALRRCGEMLHNV